MKGNITFRKVTTRFPMAHVRWYVYVNGKRAHKHKYFNSYIHLYNSGVVYKDFVIVYEGNYVCEGKQEAGAVPVSYYGPMKVISTLIEAKRILAELIGKELE